MIRLLGDFDLAEEAVQKAFSAALEHWPCEGTPGNPRAWLVSAGRNKAVDLLRRQARFEAKRDELARLSELAEKVSETPEESMLADDRLRLIFTCCHAALAREAQVPLTLRTLCGLSTEGIARAFLVPLPTMAQRLVRAQRKIRDAGIPYRVPADEELGERLETVLLVVYLVFNEGYSATSGDVTGAAGAVRRGDPPGAAASQTDAGSCGSRGTAGAYAAARFATRHADECVGRNRTARGARPYALA